MALLTPEQMAHLARTLVELAQTIIGLQRDSGVGAELEQRWNEAHHSARPKVCVGDAAANAYDVSGGRRVPARCW